MIQPEKPNITKSVLSSAPVFFFLSATAFLIPPVACENISAGTNTDKNESTMIERQQPVFVLLIPESTIKKPAVCVRSAEAIPHRHTRESRLVKFFFCIFAQSIKFISSVQFPPCLYTILTFSSPRRFFSSCIITSFISTKSFFCAICNKLSSVVQKQSGV